MGTLKQINREHLTVFFWGTLILGLYSEIWFRALPSIATGGLFLVTLFSPTIKSDFRDRFLQNKGLLLFTLVFWIHVLSYFYTDTENMSYLWSRIQMKIPFLLLPLAITLLPKLSRKQYYFLMYWFFIVTTVTAILCTINYIIHFDEMQLRYLRSKTMPVPVNHVRYSLMIAFAMMVGAILYIKKFVLIKSWERNLILGISIFLFLFLHLLSVRSGMLAFYLSLGLGVLIYMIKKRKYGLGIGFISALILLPIVCYYTLPSFEAKVINTSTDISKLGDEESANNHSLTGRIFSYKVGWAVFESNPIIGTGAGNILAEVKKEYARSYPSITNILQPHNQYLRYMVAFGSIGFLVFLISFYYVFFYKRNIYLDAFLILQLITVSTSFLFEGTIETQLGVNYVLIFTLLPLYYIESNRVDLESQSDPWFNELEA